MKKIIQINAANALRGVLSAITADLAFLMVYPILFRIVTGYPPAGNTPLQFLTVMIIGPVAAGIPGGILYGLFMGNKKRNSRAAVRFWLTFWILASTLWILGIILLSETGLYPILAISLSLFVFTGIWTYLMDVILKNPLTFDHLMPEEMTASESQEKMETPYSNTLIKKRRD
ncbi:MAG TPA: hypothetical protein GX691_08385 [Clostridia bacterium]|nr:hypothetical protein [Clostridia bacterium]